MERRQKIQQMADILVDWCEADLEQVGQNNVTPGLVSLTAVRSVIWTCQQDPDAWRLLKELVEEGD